jgi:filamentous hemagglutinin family protein
LDGSLGSPAIDLPGPNYQIDAEQGTLMGRNLFHSFKTFNVNHNESVIFTGPKTVANIIGRVTGGNLSHINGTLTSTIQNADLYLLNPAGFMVGRNAFINVNGSFYLSSANYLRFADGQQFTTDSSTRPLLSVAAPEAFGFWENPVGHITINGRMKVAASKELAVIGGDIRITGGDLFAPKGHINMLSAASAGEVMRSKMINNTFSQFGNVTIEQQSSLDVNALHGEAGAVVIRGGQFYMSNSHIQALAETGTGNIEIVANHELHLTDNSDIQIRTTQDIPFTQNAGDIVLRGQQVKVSKGSYISNVTDGTGESGNIIITAKDAISVTDNNSLIISATNSTGNGGNIALRANHINIQQGGIVTTESVGQGQAGDIHLNADNLLITNSEVSSLNYREGKGGTLNMTATDSIRIDTGSILAVAKKGSEGEAGKIDLSTADLKLTNGTQINASSEGTGKGGQIDINVTGTIDISGNGYLVDTETGEITDKISPSGIASSTFSSGQGGNVHISAQTLNLDNWGTIQTLTKGDGNAGNILIDVYDLRITNGGDIDASNEGTGSGKGGNIEMTVNGSALITAKPADDEMIGSAKPVVKNDFLGGIYSIAENEGSGGDVTLTTPQLELRDGGVISVGSIGFGDAGHLRLFINNALNMENAAIITRASQAGGGDIHIETPHAHLINSAITAEAQGTEPFHHGGNLAIEKTWLLTLDNSQLLANAKWGRGGNIDIHAEQIKSLGNNQIDVSSEFGLNGQLFLNDIELSDITVLPLDYLNAAKWLKQRCVTRFGNNLNHFNIVTYQMLPLSPYDFHSFMPIFNELSLDSEGQTVALAASMDDKLGHRFGCTFGK